MQYRYSRVHYEIVRAITTLRLLRYIYHINFDFARNFATKFPSQHPFAVIVVAWYSSLEEIRLQKRWRDLFANLLHNRRRENIEISPFRRGCNKSRRLFIYKNAREIFPRYWRGGTVRESFSVCEGFENNRRRNGGYRFSLKQRAPESLFFCARVYVCTGLCLLCTCTRGGCGAFMYTTERSYCTYKVIN